MPGVLPSQCDVLVVGAGASGMTAALTAAAAGLATVLCEADTQVGGAMALAPGHVWLPLALPEARQAADDRQEDVLSYLRGLAGKHYPVARAVTFVRNAARLHAFLAAEAGLALTHAADAPDFYQDVEGARLEGRSFVPPQFNGRKLGQDFALLRAPRELQGEPAGWRASLRAGTERALGYQRSTTLDGGNALAGALLLALRQHGVEVVTDARVMGLLPDGKRISGADVMCGTQMRRIGIAKAVVIASGGFGAGSAWRADHLGLDDAATARTLAPGSCSGDGIEMAMALGARLHEDVMDHAAWVPASVLPGDAGETRMITHQHDRGKPGFVAVDASANRFANEAGPAHDFVKAMMAAAPDAAAASAILVCDQLALRRYGIGAVPPGRGRTRRFIDNGYLTSAPTIEHLGVRLGLPVKAFCKTIDDYNALARAGADPVFRKGVSAVDKILGDVTHRPNPCVAALDTGPFFAVRLVPGDIATHVGLKVDVEARVLGRDGQPVKGLYAVGHDAAQVFGGTWPAPGAGLGSAMVSGFLAARHIAYDLDKDDSGDAAN